MATVGSTCLQHDTINLSDQNHIILLIRVSQILMKENNEFISIFQAWPILSQAKQLSYREISSDRHKCLPPPSQIVASASLLLENK